MSYKIKETLDLVRNTFKEKFNDYLTENSLKPVEVINAPFNEDDEYVMRIYLPNRDTMFYERDGKQMLSVTVDCLLDMAEETDVEAYTDVLVEFINTQSFGINQEIVGIQILRVDMTDNINAFGLGLDIAISYLMDRSYLPSR